MSPKRRGRLLLFALSVASNVGAEVPPISAELVATKLPKKAAPGMHPAVVLRDVDGVPVVESHGLLSYARTCGTCHDTTFIAEHGYHFRVGLDEQTPLGQAPSKRAWDFGTGLFGRWDPLAGYDSVFVDPKLHGEAFDRWIAENRPRLLGGGPAALGTKSPSFEVNCALCHVPGAALSRDRVLPFAAYQTAALEPLGIVTVRTRTDASIELDWHKEAFETDGSVKASHMVPHATQSSSCGSCHGMVTRERPHLVDYGRWERQTETTGQVFSSTRMSDSQLNLTHRDALARPWDVHAERLLECADCHFSPNDPAASFRIKRDPPAQLKHEVRIESFGEFLKRPSHEFAKGHSSQGQFAARFDGTMRRCEDCHDAPKAHGWLPKADRHLAQVACEICHVDTVSMPARRVTDYSVIDRTGQPRVEYRGLEGSLSDPSAPLTGYRPVWLRRVEDRAPARLFPYNIVTSFFWLVDEPEGTRPASIALLKRAFYELAGAEAKLTELLDRNRDGKLSERERTPTTQAQLDGVKNMLVAGGARNPRLVGEMQPYAVHHGVGPARFALRDCAACHSQTSRLIEPFTLAEQAPFGVRPALIGDSNVFVALAAERTASGSLFIRPEPTKQRLHVLGLSGLPWLDRLGLALVGLVFLGALSHGSMRFVTAMRRKRRSA